MTTRLTDFLCWAPKEGETRAEAILVAEQTAGIAAKTFARNRFRDQDPTPVDLRVAVCGVGGSDVTSHYRVQIKVSTTYLIHRED